MGDRVNVQSEFRSLHVTYDHRDLSVWTTYLSRRKSLPPSVPSVSTDSVIGKNTIIAF